MKRCLFCYDVLTDESSDFHAGCARKFFGKPVPPELPYSEDQMFRLAEKVIRSRASVPGAQAKLSLGIEKMPGNDKPDRFTIVGLWGGYILKPPSKQYGSLPELEDLTMHLAEISGIRVVPHSLIRLSSGALSYITRRIDRNDSQKIHMEDMCQLTEKLTEQKYNGSYEQIGRAIINYSVNPGLDIINYFEQVTFSYLTGNADMHLKNFSLIDYPETGYILSPAYDMVASSLVVEGDDEDLALTLNGKKKKINKKDFVAALGRFNAGEKAIENIFKKFAGAMTRWHEFIDISFLPDEMKKAYHEMLDKKALRLLS